MRSLQVLVVDDEVAVRQVLAAHLRDAGHSVEHLGTGEEALERLRKGDVDLALCDIRLPDTTGIEVMRSAISAGVDTQFLVMTAFASVATAIEAMKSGAFDYLIKPIRAEDLKHRVSQIAKVITLKDENRRLRALVGGDSSLCSLTSAAARDIKQLVAKVAATEGTVLITGESGTGKSGIAREIHHQSPRSLDSFVQVNCGAIPDALLESEFFGHLKGAFTGAVRAKKGLVREADGGTLLLDEISELPLLLQVKLLHLIEGKEIRPVGSEQGRRVNVRILAATNQDLEEAVKAGAFRDDLYYRLNVLQIEIPPLRDRPEDIETLVTYFLATEPKRLAVEGEFSISSRAMEALRKYQWPGNIRELQNVINHALILTDTDEIGIGDLPRYLYVEESAANARSANVKTLREQVNEFESAVIQEAIDRAGGDRQMAAKMLGIGVSTLYRKLESHEKAPHAELASYNH